MKDKLKITKEDLVSWLDRPPSNEDLDLCSYLANALEKQQYYLIMKELKIYLKDRLNTMKQRKHNYANSMKVLEIKTILDKIKELEEGVKE